MSQIAGRAGRFKNDGGSGTTGDCETLNSDEIEKLKNINYLILKLFIGEIQIRLPKSRKTNCFS